MSTQPVDPSSWKNRLEASQAGRAGRAVETLPRLPGDDLPQGGREAAGRLPRVRLSLVRPRPAADRPGARRRDVRGMGRRPGSADPLEFVDKIPYPQRLEEEQRRTGLREAAVVGTGMIRGRPVAFGVTDSAFIMGSMGSVVGEKLTRTVERATAATVAADHHFRLRRRRPDARGHALPDADGQGLGGAWPATTRPADCSSPC